MKKVAVKIGLELLIPINIIFLWILFKGIAENKISAITIGVIVMIFVNIIFFGIKYYFENEYLHIKSPFHNLKIDIQSITKIEKTSNLFSSPAPSIFGRVEVYYQNNSIVISPRNFDEFKNELLKMNPNIIVKE
ncbi:PH domain-containing protein [Cloacibacterium caeni]|jgi:hypothetical protein|uniref:PH domain-containing protein n=1 Tax=Cloacibacterium caeni TaxID=2004710 RepID=UPI001BD16177|nr:PH domain-containing protein [Cloacibacterium caeni]